MAETAAISPTRSKTKADPCNRQPRHSTRNRCDERAACLQPAAPGTEPNDGSRVNTSLLLAPESWRVCGSRPGQSWLRRGRSRL